VDYGLTCLFRKIFSTEKYPLRNCPTPSLPCKGGRSMTSKLISVYSINVNTSSTNISAVRPYFYHFSTIFQSPNPEKNRTGYSYPQYPVSTNIQPPKNGTSYPPISKYQLISFPYFAEGIFPRISKSIPQYQFFQYFSRRLYFHHISIPPKPGDGLAAFFSRRDVIFRKRKDVEPYKTFKSIKDFNN